MRNYSQLSFFAFIAHNIPLASTRKCSSASAIPLRGYRYYTGHVLNIDHKSLTHFNHLHFPNHPYENIQDWLMVMVTLFGYLAGVTVCC
jgi:hypothetical protein